MKALIILLILYVCYRQIKKMFSVQVRHSQAEPKNQQGVDDVLVQDPVCGVYFQKSSGVASKIDGERKLFCSEKCKDNYIKYKGEKHS